MSWSVETNTTEQNDVEATLTDQLDAQTGMTEVEDDQADAAMAAVAALLKAFGDGPVRVVISGSIEPDVVSVRVDAVP